MKCSLSILLALPLLCQGQGNLVPNGSFEEITSCPTSSAQIHQALPWMNDIGGAELFHSCNPGTPDGDPHVGVPLNGVGYQYAHSGEAYAGIYTYGGPNETNGREYLQVPLIEPIHASRRYIVSFWASLADEFDYAVGSLGAYFSDTILVRTSFNSLPDVEPSIQSPPGQIFSDKDLWYLITDTFTSRVGGERYIIIGNFKSTAESDTLFVPTDENGSWKSYYYIDDVSVIALDSIPNSMAEPTTEPALTLTVWPNPATSLLHIRTGRPLVSVQLRDMLGRMVHSEDAQGTGHTLHLGGIPPGLYLLEAHHADGRRAVKRITLMDN